MKNLVCLLAVLAACSNAESPAPTPSPTVAPTVAPPTAPIATAPTVRFVAWQADTVTFFDASSTSITQVREVSIPSAIDEVRWIGDEVLVRYDEKRIGRITATGFEAQPAGASSTWKKKAAALPPIVPTKTTLTTFEVEYVQIMRCTRDNVTVEIPAADAENRTYGVDSDVEWLSDEPAIFRVTQYYEGDPTTEKPSVFENCKETSYRDAVRGPHDMLALVGEQTSIRRDGREIGTVPDSQVAFAP